MSFMTILRKAADSHSRYWTWGDAENGEFLVFLPQWWEPLSKWSEIKTINLPNVSAPNKLIENLNAALCTNNMRVWYQCVFLPQVMKVSSSCSLVRLWSTSTLTTSQPSPPASCFDWWRHAEVGTGARCHGNKENLQLLQYVSREMEQEENLNEQKGLFCTGRCYQRENSWHFPSFSLSVLHI